MSETTRIAVLGAGIMGCSTALFLARRGFEVSLFDAAARPFSGASRWNEGKIHLGFLYSADRSLNTACRIIPGGLMFKPLVEELIDCPIGAATTAADDIYLCHRESLVPAEAIQAYFERVCTVVRAQPDASRYLVDVTAIRAEKLTAAELAALSGSPDIVAGFRVPERSVSTTWIADRFVDALAAERRIVQHMATSVTAARPRSASDPAGSWLIDAADGVHGPYDVVVNALWEGRLPIDITAGLETPLTWSNRYRLALFVRTREPVDMPSLLIATGPFGDIKNYNGRDFYLSWYPAGMVMDSSAVSPPPAPLMDEPRQCEICESVLDNLSRLIPGTARIRERIEQLTLAGGWVFAAGQGELSDPQSTLHRRSDFGVKKHGAYLSVDTGKYSTAPWLARRIADRIR